MPNKGTGFLYFIPSELLDDRPAASIATLLAIGLDKQFGDEAPVAARGVVTGPDGAGGSVVASTQRVEPGQIRWDPEHQEWSEMTEPAGVWLGTYTASPPIPDVLIRKKDLVDGRMLELADSFWMVPLVREWRGNDQRFHPALPTRAAVVNGVVRQVAISERYQKLWEYGVRWFAQVEAAKVRDKSGNDLEQKDVPDDGDPNRRFVVTFDFDEGSRAAVDVLSYNYAIGIDEAVRLGLLDGSGTVNILNTMVDYLGWLDWVLDAGKDGAGDGKSS